jgi:hypothetical protein
VPYNLFGLFLVHKYQYISIYMKMGKRNGKRKRKRNFQLAGPGGNFGPATRARASAQLRPKGEGDGAGARERRRHCGPTCQRERRGGGTAPRFDSAGEPDVCGEENPAAGGLDGDSPPVARFLVHGEVA